MNNNRQHAFRQSEHLFLFVLLYLQLLHYYPYVAVAVVVVIVTVSMAIITVIIFTARNGREMTAMGMAMKVPNKQPTMPCARAQLSGTLLLLFL
ncbi:hypothetical protein T492DRAFT_1035070 [Pavlovales sp. CCMP2436]|nr:hypothetical protein T492DRAFT_1035070 [Pavlovales sp. CCMP2436]